MYTSNTRPVTAQALRICLASILFLFFLQLLTEYVESIYLFGLLGSSIPPEIGMVLLFLSPLVLVNGRKKMAWNCPGSTPACRNFSRYASSSYDSTQFSLNICLVLRLMLVPASTSHTPITSSRRKDPIIPCPFSFNLR